MNPKVFHHPGESGQVSTHSLLIIAQIVIILIAIGIFVAVLGPSRTIYCERTTENNVDCTITKSLFGVIPLDEYAIPGVLAANLDQRCNGDNCAYALQMYGTSGFVAVDDDYVSDLALRQQVADAINEFLQNPDSRNITLQDQVKPVVYIGAGAALLVLFGLLGYSIWQGRRVE
jgi:hypothetical protein